MVRKINNKKVGVVLRNKQNKNETNLMACKFSFRFLRTTNNKFFRKLPTKKFRFPLDKRIEH